MDNKITLFARIIFVIYLMESIASGVIPCLEIAQYSLWGIKIETHGTQWGLDSDPMRDPDFNWDALAMTPSGIPIGPLYHYPLFPRGFPDDVFQYQYEDWVCYEFAYSYGRESTYLSDGTWRADVNGVYFCTGYTHTYHPCYVYEVDDPGASYDSCLCLVPLGPEDFNTPDMNWMPSTGIINFVDYAECLNSTPPECTQSYVNFVDFVNHCEIGDIDLYAVKAIADCWLDETDHCEFVGSNVLWVLQHWLNLQIEN